jgi:hypothetical protein
MGRFVTLRSKMQWIGYEKQKFFVDCAILDLQL